jgi:hypothetical protein
MSGMLSSFRRRGRIRTHAAQQNDLIVAFCTNRGDSVGNFLTAGHAGGDDDRLSRPRYAAD